GLGVATYYGFADQQRLQDLAKKEKQEKDAIARSRDWHRLQNLLLKTYLGHTLVKEDQDALADLLPKYQDAKIGTDKDDNKTDFDNLVDKLGPLVQKQGVSEKAILGWADNKPKKTCFQLLSDLDAEVTKLRGDLAQAQKNKETELAEVNNKLKASEDTANELRTKLDLAKKETANVINTKAKEYTDRLAELEKLQNEVDETKKKADKANDDANKVAAKLKEDNKELKN